MAFLNAVGRHPRVLKADSLHSSKKSRVRRESSGHTFFAVDLAFSFGLVRQSSRGLHVPGLSRDITPELLRLPVT